MDHFIVGENVHDQDIFWFSAFPFMKQNISIGSSFVHNSGDAEFQLMKKEGGACVDGIKSKHFLKNVKCNKANVCFA